MSKTERRGTEGFEILVRVTRRVPSNEREITNLMTKIIDYIDSLSEGPLRVYQRQHQRNSQSRSFQEWDQIVVYLVPGGSDE